MGSNPESSSCCGEHVADLSVLGPQRPPLCQVDRHLRTCRLSSDPGKGSGNGAGLLWLHVQPGLLGALSGQHLAPQEAWRELG